MLITICPWTGNERLNNYRQSQQLAGQTGLIGKLSADFGSDGRGSYSTGEHIRIKLKMNDEAGTAMESINEPKNESVIILLFSVNKADCFFQATVAGTCTELTQTSTLTSFT